MTVKLDVRGEICPYPMLKAVQEMKRLPYGEVLEVITDHAPALESIPLQAKRLGFSAEIKKTGTAEWVITLKRTLP